MRLYIFKNPVLMRIKSVIKKCLCFIKLYKYIVSNPKEAHDTKDTIYLVYSMGKNGSSSVYQTLKNRFPHLNIFHVHFLSDSGLKEAEEFTKRKGQTLEANKIKTVIDQNPNKVLKIITLVREPMARDVSDLFHNLSIYMKEFGMKEFDIDELINNYS